MIKRHLATTLQSVARQTTPNWDCVVVANRGAELPNLPVQCRAVWVDLPYTPMPADATREDLDEAVRLDKGLRLLAGLRDLDTPGHVMLTDSDDWVSPRLATLVCDNSTANGWFFDKGYLYSGGPLAYLYPSDFYMFCGTSHVVRSDLLLPGDDGAEPDIEAVKTRLGSHVSIKRLLDEEGTPLRPLPFVGAVYRMGHATSDSRSGALLDHLFQGRNSSKTALGRISRLRLARLLGFGLPG